MSRVLIAVSIVPFLIASTSGRSLQTPASTPPPQLTQPEAVADEQSDQGLPVTNETTKRKCSACHHEDSKGRLTRISFRRTTPEGWEETIKRMISLNKLKIEPAEAREVLRYLADHHGLAPEEATPAAFEVERRQEDFKYTADKDTEATCTACHSMGRVISQRRTRQEWELLLAMHRGYYPLVDFQAFRRMQPLQREPGPDGHPPDNRHPMEKALAHLTTAFPLNTPEWAAWSATMRPPQLAGRWALSGTQPGKGPIFGTVTIAQGAGPAEYTTEISYVVPKTGEQVSRTGKAIVYTGFQWRGRNAQAGGSNELREVMFVDRDWRHASGRWFTGAYNEFGSDVTLTRVGNDPLILGVDKPMLKAGVDGQELRLYGQLPATLSPDALNFGPGIKVDRIVNASTNQATVAVSVAPDATAGRRSVFLAGAAGDATVAVYKTIDYIKVTPEAGLARVGGENFPKMYAQFEAVAYANGNDGKPNTSDDIELGPVDASWAIEEYTATYDDDDKDFVGTIDPATGLFTPNLDGPNPKRRHNANNYGDVWVVATFTPSHAEAPRSIRARGHLLVTVPIYIKFDQAEVGQ